MSDTYLKHFLRDRIAGAYRSLFDDDPPAAQVRPNDRPEFGDYATNLAMIAANQRGEAPRALAEKLAAALVENEAEVAFTDAQVAGPGFINLFLSPSRIQAALGQLLADGTSYGRGDDGRGLKLQVEFVSSNPTGPLTVGHGRQAVLGDVLATLHDWIGYDVHREYYFNDEGRQIDLLAESLWIRFRERFGESREIPEGGYQGEYLKAIGADLADELGDAYAAFDDEVRALFRREAVARMTETIKDDLAELGVQFDSWFSEAALHRSGEVDATLNELRARDGVYDADGAVWLKAEAFGGAKDSVLIRSDGRPTYLMVDIAYHINKRDRGFERVLNVQGADHHAEQTCVKAGLRILGYPDEFLDYAIHQFVSLKEKGEVQKMSTRAGRFVTLRDLVDDLGRDVVRYFMISRKPEAHLDFDLDLAHAESQDNPATYIQYAHTRIVSIFRKAACDDVDWAAVDLSPLEEPEELELIKRLDEFPEIVHTAATTFGPHLVAEYGHQVSRAFHSYYDRVRVLGEAEAVTRARLALLEGIRLVLRNTLDILGMSIPETM